MADDETSARRKAWAKATGMVNQAPPDSTPDTPVPSDPAGSLDVIVRDPDTGELVPRAVSTSLSATPTPGNSALTGCRRA